MNIDEIEIQQGQGSYENWDWEHLKQIFATHLMIDASFQKIKENIRESDQSDQVVIDWLIDQAKSVYKAREALIPEEILNNFERFVILRTIDEKWKDHLYAMDQLREGINLRAYGQKNPLLEYKSEGFKMFQEMMNDMNSLTIQRLFRTQISGINQNQNRESSQIRNMKVSHQDTTGMGFQNTISEKKANKPQQVRTPIIATQKQGRNQKIVVRSPSGEEIQIKFKKLQNYLNKGYTQV